MEPTRDRGPGRPPFAEDAHVGVGIAGCGLPSGEIDRSPSTARRKVVDVGRLNPFFAGLGQMNVSEVVDVVFQAIGAAETVELEWKLQWDLSTRPRRADLARHILGMANRDPDQAARLFGGHAFLVIGVEPGRIGSAPELDPADLVQLLTPYLGTQLGWRPTYVTYQGSRALVITVDPPYWGDPIWRLQRSSEDPRTGRLLQAGAVFVRRAGTTVPADADDIQRLEARAQAPRPGVSVVTEWNLGRQGRYVGVGVSNEVGALPALLHDVGFAMPGIVTAQNPSAPGAPEGQAYARLPLFEGRREIPPGESLSFRVSVDRSAPVLWDADTDFFPYAYFDGRRWVHGEPSKIIRNLQTNGWRNDPNARPMFDTLVLDYISPEEAKGQRARVDLAKVA